MLDECHFLFLLIYSENFLFGRRSWCGRGRGWRGIGQGRLVHYHLNSTQLSPGLGLEYPFIIYIIVSLNSLLDLNPASFPGLAYCCSCQRSETNTGCVHLWGFVNYMHLLQLWNFYTCYDLCFACLFLFRYFFLCFDFSNWWKTSFNAIHLSHFVQSTVMPMACSSLPLNCL